MTLKEHYKFHSRKSAKPLVNLFLLIFLILTIPNTFAKYSNITENNALMETAKWSITINGEQITANTGSLNNSISLINSQDGTTKVDVGDECYFDLIIDPSLTEVAISYSISVDLESQDTTLPEGTKIEKYQKYIGTSEEPQTVNVNDTRLSISEDIDLSSTNEALEETNKRKYRIYCILPDYLNAEKDQEYTVAPNIIIQQNI